MSVDPHIDHCAHDPEDRPARSEDPRLREAEELEARLRRALATKENPMHDDEPMSARLRRTRSAEGADSPERPRAD